MLTKTKWINYKKMSYPCPISGRWYKLNLPVMRKGMDAATKLSGMPMKQRRPADAPMANTAEFIPHEATVTLLTTQSVIKHDQIENIVRSTAATMKFGMTAKVRSLSSLETESETRNNTEILSE